MPDSMLYIYIYNKKSLYVKRNIKETIEFKSDCKTMLYRYIIGFPLKRNDSDLSVSLSYEYPVVYSLYRCGLRGGYMELVNFDPEVKKVLLKSISAKLCSTVLGQAAMDCVVKPPVQGDPSYELFVKEKEAVLEQLRIKAKMVASTFNTFEGFKCNPVAGAMYAFPRLSLPQRAIKKAESLNQQPDFFYVKQLLEETGICVVPGSGFGQKPGTFHFR